jgi:hypothetical protein
LKPNIRFHYKHQINNFIAKSMEFSGKMKFYVFSLTI